MRALFFVYTPFQFLVAQSIIKQEGFKNSVLIEGYVGDNTHFLDVYKLLKIDELWASTYVIPELPRWDGLVIRSINDAKKAYFNYKRIRDIATKNHCDTFFLGENKNQSIRFTAKVFSHLGFHIAYFEEGLAHYIVNDCFENKSITFKLKVWLRDILYYIPIYHIRFAKWRYQPGLPLDEKFPMAMRYSVLPVFQGDKERIVLPTPIFSQKLQKYLEKESLTRGRKVLLLTQPLQEVYGEIPNFEDVYLNVIKQAIKDISQEVTLFVKFHPRDIGKNRKRLLKTLSTMNRKYQVLSEDINLPVEIYLQYMNFERIFFFFSSTFAYNGYLFPKQEFVCLLPKLNEECTKIAKHKFAFYKQIMELFDKISQLRISN